MNTTRIDGRSGPKSHLMPAPPAIVISSTPQRQTDSDGRHRRAFLVGSYGLMWFLLHLCCYFYYQQSDDWIGQPSSFYLWLGLLFGQMASVLAWPPNRGVSQWFQHLFALLLIGVGSWLFSDLLTGSTQQWWVASVVLMLGSQSAGWALQRPLSLRSRAERKLGNYSLSQWLVFSMWLAVVMSLTPTIQADWSQSAALVACFGGLSLFLAIQRFAFQQLFWPSHEHWPHTQTHRVWQVVDRVGVLAMIVIIQGGLAWGLWQYYGSAPQAGLVFSLCCVAAWWQAIDVSFARLVQSNGGHVGVLNRRIQSAQVLLDQTA